MAEALESIMARPANRGARRRTETRRRLLAAARTVFAREGLEAATIAQITAEADAGFGTFYLHFATKEEAYRAVVTEGFSELAAELERVRSETAERREPWHAMTRAAVRAYGEFATRNRALFTVMFAGGGVGLGLSRELGERFAAGIAAQLIQSGAEEASAPDQRPWPYPPMPVAIATVAALTRTILWWLGQNESQEQPDESGFPPSLETLIETMSRYVTAALWGRVPG
ncbi:MAG TPA: helix-turn-helix domain-containing protein [Ktedonobacterales bacterium]|nr:helix-turn-helix domain-containing protein [Ktedonobacterales bacterium]